jgi:1-acyl-sn-glycerol-3-phosphate acyltransferase
VSWADILLVQSVLVRDGPLLKFLTKRELVFIPVLGVIFWAFDFPLLRRQTRGSKDVEARRRADAEALSSACEVVRARPAALMNFAEGTRLTEEKRLASASPYRHLLTPRVGGLSALVEALGDDLVSIVDVSLIYPETPSFWAFAAGQVGPIEIEIERITIAELPGGREALSGWLAEQWRRKDERIDHVRAQRSS